MENVTSTVLASRQQVFKLITPVTGRYRPIDNMSLNQKFNVLADAVPDVGVWPSVNYMAIGKGGHVADVTSDGTPTHKEITHDFSDPALYDQLPLVARRIDDDLSASERAKYRLRTLRNYGGVDYWVYWLKKIEIDTDNIVMEHNTTVDGNTVSEEFVPTIENLSPEKPDINNVDVNETSRRTLTVSSIQTIDLSAAEISEIRNACNVVFGDPNTAIISEVAVISGIDRTVNANGGDGSEITMTEAICAEILFFIKGVTTLSSSQTRFTATFDLGATEPVRDAE